RRPCDTPRTLLVHPGHASSIRFYCFRVTATRAPEFIGRERECAELDELLRSVRGGESQVLVVRGEAGIGKTALLEYCARQAAGCRLVQLAGVGAEAEPPSAGAQQRRAPA